jgi:hypothetical protein
MLFCTRGKIRRTLASHNPDIHNDLLLEDGQFFSQETQNCDLPFMMTFLIFSLQDLKKQTALRLAQEQQQHHGRHRNPTTERKEVVLPQRQPPDQSANLFSGPSYQQPPDPYPYPGYPTPMSQQPPSHHQGYEYQAFTHQSSNSMHVLNTYENSSCASDSVGQGYDQVVGNKRPKPRNQRKPHHQAPQPQLNAHRVSSCYVTCSANRIVNLTLVLFLPSKAGYWLRKLQVSARSAIMESTTHPSTINCGSASTCRCRCLIPVSW